MALENILALQTISALNTNVLGLGLGLQKSTINIHFFIANLCRTLVEGLVKTAESTINKRFGRL